MYVYMYILLDTGTVTYYVTDTSSRQGARPVTNKASSVLTIPKIWSRVPEGPDAKKDLLTDRQL